MRLVPENLGIKAGWRRLVKREKHIPAERQMEKIFFSRHLENSSHLATSNEEW